MEKQLKILYVCAELAPLVKTGGLGDVANALPRALDALGHDVRVALPCYGTIPSEFRGNPHCICVADLGFRAIHGALRVATVPDTKIPLYLIEHQLYFNRPHPYSQGGYEYQDNLERFCFFSLAVLHGVPQTGWAPDIVHCHDWHTALIPAYIKLRETHDKMWNNKPTLFTIHNLAYQGRYPAPLLPYTGLGWEVFKADGLEFHGDINLMKGGIAYATRINTVSPTYAQEILTPEFGEGLDDFLGSRAEHVTGILNGVDYAEWNPTSDVHLEANYSINDLSGKAWCKKALQKQLDLPQDNVPLFGMVSRMVWQKGLDLLAWTLDRIMARAGQLIVLGTGDPWFESLFAESQSRFPDKLRMIAKFDNRLAHEIMAGCDFLLMPSHFEPSGLSQMYGLAYGTVPIVRKTGGLADTVRDINVDNITNGRATGIVFEEPMPEALAEAVARACALYEDTESLHAVRVAGMKQDFSWDRSAKAYVELYRAAIGIP